MTRTVLKSVLIWELYFIFYILTFVSFTSYDMLMCL